MEDSSSEPLYRSTGFGIHAFFSMVTVSRDEYKYSRPTFFFSFLITFDFAVAAVFNSIIKHDTKTKFIFKYSTDKYKKAAVII